MSDHVVAAERLYKNEVGSDCTVTLSGSGGETPVRYPGHRTVLEAASPVFRTSLRNWNNVDGSCNLDISAASVAVAEAILSFVHFGRLPDDVRIRDVVHVLLAADKYAIPRLVEDCVWRWGCHDLIWSDRVAILNLPAAVFDAHHCVTVFVRNHVDPVVRDGFRDLETSWKYPALREWFLRLPATSVIALLSWTELAATEDAVLIAVLSWMQCQARVDQGTALSLFATLKLHRLSPTFLTGVLRTVGVFRPFVTQDVLYEVIKHGARGQHKRRNVTQSSSPRPVANAQVTSDWRISMEHIESAFRTMEDLSAPWTVTLLGPKTYFGGVWWEPVVQWERYESDDDSWRTATFIGVMPSIKTERLPAAGSVVESERVVLDNNTQRIDHAGEETFRGRKVAAFDDPTPDLFRIPSLHKFELVIEIGLGERAFYNTARVDCAGCRLHMDSLDDDDDVNDPKWWESVSEYRSVKIQTTVSFGDVV